MEEQNTEQENINNTEEKSENSTLNINTEELKKETAQTVKEVKDTIKNTNFKADTKVAKGFFKDFFKNPIEELKKVASDSKNSFLKIAIIILVAWLVIILVTDIFAILNTYLFGYLGSFSYFFRHLFANILNIVKDLIAPIISIATISGLTYLFNKNKNKSFITIINTVLIAKIPVIIATLVSALTIISSKIITLTSLFSGFCNMLSTVLLYFGIKELLGEEENKSCFWKFTLIIGIFYIVKLVFSYLGVIL